MGIFIMVMIGVRIDVMISQNQVMVRDLCAWENYQSETDQLDVLANPGYPVFVPIADCNY